MDRRQFLKLSGLSAAATGTLALGPGTATAVTSHLRIKRASEVHTVCPYCSVGCGMIAHVENGKLINLEGDADHPISEGSLCPKGSSAFQFAYNERRMTKVLYRKPFAQDWETVTLDWAMAQVAARVKDTRDKHFIEHRVEHCGACGHYLKVINQRVRARAVDVFVTDGATYHLDRLAEAEGFCMGGRVGTTQ